MWRQKRTWCAWVSVCRATCCCSAAKPVPGAGAAAAERRRRTWQLARNSVLKKLNFFVSIHLQKWGIAVFLLSFPCAASRVVARQQNRFPAGAAAAERRRTSYLARNSVQKSLNFFCYTNTPSEMCSCCVFCWVFKICVDLQDHCCQVAYFWAVYIKSSPVKILGTGLREITL